MYCYYALRAYSLESSLGSGKRKQDSDVRSGLRFLRFPHSLVSAGIRIEHSQIQPSSLIKSLGHKWFYLLKTTFSWSFATLNTPHTSKKSLRKSKAKIGCSIRQRWPSAGKAYITLSLFLRSAFLFLSFMLVSLNSSNINSSPAQLLHNQLWSTRIGPPPLYILSNSEIELVLYHDLDFIGQN